MAKVRTAILCIAAATAAFLLHVAMPLGRLLWPPSQVPMAEPNALQSALFLAYSVGVAIAFGLGVVFLSRGSRRRSRDGATGPTWPAMLAIGWLLVSWIPHDNLHMFFGFRLWGLLLVEYLFHGTIILAGLVLARFFLRVTADGSPRPTGRPDRIGTEA